MSKEKAPQMLQDVLERLDWHKSHLIPAIIQDFENLEVLMLGFVSRESLELSLQTGLMHYFSRSKNRIWKKGESSGCIQRIKSIKLDCDRDSLVVLVQQDGVSCHTGERSCFYQSLGDCISHEPSHQTSPENRPQYGILDDLYHILLDRKSQDPAKSYVSSLYHKGINTICKKIGEEGAELICEMKGAENGYNDEAKEKIIYESTDLFFHLLIALAYFNLHPEVILNELRRRFGVSGIEEKASRGVGK